MEGFAGDEKMTSSEVWVRGKPFSIIRALQTPEIFIGARGERIAVQKISNSRAFSSSGSISRINRRRNKKSAKKDLGGSDI